MNVNSFIGIPFKDKGRDRSGCDCWGLVYIYYQEVLNILLPTYLEFYENTLDPAITETIANETLYGDWVKIEEGEERAGDVVILRIVGLPWHVGIIVGDGKMIHTEKGTDCILEKYKERKWNKRVLGFYRHQSLAT